MIVRPMQYIRIGGRDMSEKKQDYLHDESADQSVQDDTMIQADEQAKETGKREH